MKIGQNIKNIRLSQGKTQKEVAEMGGFRQGIYANWENDRYLPGAESLIKLADCFGCTVDYLLGRESEDGSIVIAQQYDFSDNEWKMIKMFHALNGRRQSLALVYVAALYDSEIKGI